MAIPHATLPKYSIELPCSKKKISYRPFIVKEEKILLLAIEENDNERIAEAVYQVAEGCTYGKVDVRELPELDLEYLFLNIRNKSMGEGVEVESTCTSCGHKNSLTLDFTKTRIKGDLNRDSTFQVSDTAWVTLGLPKLSVSLMAYDATELKNPDVAMNVVARCIQKIVVGDESYTITSEADVADAVDFLEGLTRDQLDKLNSFFDDLPCIVFEDNFKCGKCGEPNRIYLEGLQNFFD